ncbi:Coenzyme F420 hydrogenase/dehydrogenase, beta subunit C-terminal domain [Glaciecola petra]|uniref:Coenzyme F420 hydrogenase/dehydrogenase, beta subunit C-terminal domain n=1 Tax=Glaciecola petra TaxID=3075602 RepID=A0ABU2ZN32_9ALTE|nr:Coenzyme F420 hydrogenase/dehydrogenase, beta subunit C-terminal domain [Aestuariibacter sp. P117]MDT0593666.1 Coenzyme F420 hydrogenase/dehydrogenase, beta subunit C-terminal domain [Aestuariibacter sp. P117]
MIKSIHDVVKNDLCISCGACCLADKNSKVTMYEDKEKGVFLPNLKVAEPGWTTGKALEICPGKGYSIIESAKTLFPQAQNKSIELGRWITATVVRSLESEIVEKASSGGIMTSIAKYLIEQKVVDGVVVTGMDYSKNGPRPSSFIATSPDQLFEAQGSKYAPVPIFDSEADITNFNGNLAFIGTPCQIAALRELQLKDKLIQNKIKLTIANFCGGYRDLRETDKLIQRANIKKEDVNFLRYRGGGQPGSMVIKTMLGQVKALKYPDYARMTGVIKYKRCRVCVDATGELADISCGDAWIPKYLESGQSWSIALARSEYGQSIIDKLHQQRLIEMHSVSEAEVIKSQSGNLASKKVRQKARLKLYKFFRMSTPRFDGGYHQTDGGLLFELKVHISHSVFSFFEKIGIYKFIAKIIKRYPRV